MSLEDWAESGLFSREVKLYRELHREGMNVQLVTYGGTNDREWNSELDGIDVVPVYEHMSRPRTMVGELVKSFLIPWVIHPYLSRSDLFKTNQMMGAWVAVIAKLRYRKPLLLRCGYEMSEFFRHARVSRWQRSAGWLLSLVWPNWIDVKEFAPPSVRSENRHGVLFVGRISDQKNLLLLVEAIAGTDQPLLVVGDGKCTSSVRTRARALGVRVEFRGQIANELLPEIYRQCAVYVICSRYEGNPKTLLEAMACGCAVVGTDVPGTREIISHEENGLLVGEDPGELRAALRRILADKELRGKLAGAARKWVKQTHSLESAVNSEWKTYSALFGSADMRVS
jgi:glycosyltransferase involved in cell wall biosynthesis